SESVLHRVKKNVYQQVLGEDREKTKFGLQNLLDNVSRFIKQYTIASYGIAFALLLAIFFSTFSNLLPTETHTAILATKLAFAPNQYERARIALTDTTSRFANTQTVEEHIPSASQSFALTNNELAKLELKGEKGKYTTQECHQIYQKYLMYLEQENKNISQKNNPPLANLKSQISAYEELAEKKLHKYNSL